MIANGAESSSCVDDVVGRFAGGTAANARVPADPSTSGNAPDTRLFLMTPIKDLSKENLTKSPISTVNESCVVNTVENPACYTIENNSASMISEDVNVAKVETDLLDDCTRQSQIDMAKTADKCSSSTLIDVHQQNTAKSSSNLNSDCTKHTFSCNVCRQDFALDIDFRNHLEQHNINTQIALDSDLNSENEKLLEKFCCKTCGKQFDFDFDLQNHLKEHNKLTQKCNFCDKKFKFNFEVNRHIKKCHEPEASQNNINALCECSVCKVIVNKSEYNKHMKSHQNDTERATDVLSLKLCKLNGVWKSKTNFVYKCNICVEKFQSEINLIEHMTIHKSINNHKKSIDSLKTVPISSLNDIMHLVNNKIENKLKCQKCNLKFDKKENLDLHIIYCTKSSRNIWTKFLGTQNKASFVCTVCGINFNNLESLNIHETFSCMPPYICILSKTTYDTRELWSKHLDNCKAHTCSQDKVKKHIAEKSLNEAQMLAQSDHSLNLNREKSCCSTVSLRQISELLDTADSNQSFVQIEPSNLIANNCRINDIRVKDSSSNISVEKRPDILDTIYGREITKQCVLCDSMGNDGGDNGQNGETLCSNHTKRNSRLQNAAIKTETVPQVVTPVLQFVNNWLPNIKTEKDLYTDDNGNNNLSQDHSAENNETLLPEFYNTRASIKHERNTSPPFSVSNSLDIIDAANSPEPAVTQTNIVKLEQESEHLGKTVELIEKSTEYFTIKKIIYNAYPTHRTYQQPQEIIKSYTCNVCGKSCIDLHTLALHMSDHQEFSMHECIVCSKTFDTVCLWQNHLIFHQQQIDLNNSNNSTRIKFNATDASYMKSTEPQQIITPSGGNRKNKMSLNMQREFNDFSTNLNAKVNKSKTFQMNSTLPHQTSILKSFTCTYCDKTFSGQGPLTNHESSHRKSNINNMLLPNVDDILPTYYEPEETQLEVRVENNMISSDSIHTFNNTSKSFSCTYCDRTFSGQGQLTNHEKSHTKINRISQLSANNVDGILTTYEPEDTQLDMQVENNMINSDSIHTLYNTSKPFSCAYCDRKFSRKIPLINHEKSHTKPNLNNQLSTIVDDILPIHFDPEETQLDMQVENDMVNSDLIHTINNSAKLFFCSYCDKTFSGQGQLTNHEKSHTKINRINQLSTNVDGILPTYEPEETQLDMQVENNRINSDTIKPQMRKIKNKLLRTKRFVCTYCRKRFSKQCYWTNHMRIVHKIHPLLTTSTPLIRENLSQNNEFGNINSCKQSFSSSVKTKSAKEHKTNPLVLINANFNKVNVNSEGKLSYCNICHKHFAHKAALISHMHIHSNRRPYKCQYCNRTFNMKGPFTRHKIKHETMNNVKETIQIPSQNHVKMEMIEEKIKKEYQQEPNDFNNAKLVDGNLNKFTKSKTNNRIWFACDVCVQKFSTPFQLILHRRLKHENETPYVCKICNKTYDIRHRWNRHLKCHYLRNDCIKNLQNGLHTNNTKLVGNNLKNGQYRNKFKCGHCKKEYNLIYHWKNHFLLSKKCRRHFKSNVPKLTPAVQAKENSTDSIRFECRICKKTYSTDYNRKVHMTNVHKIQVDATNYLGSDEVQEPIETPQNPNDLNQKKKTGNQQSYNTNFECHLCGKFYSNSNNLSRHRNLAHSKDHRTSTCKICGRTFKHKYSYREHCKVKHKFLLNTVNGLKLNEIKSSSSTYQRVFGRKSKNINVQYTEKQTMPLLAAHKYKCDDCGQHFETNVTLGQHIMNNHYVKNTTTKIEEKVVNTASESNDNSVTCTICFKNFSSCSYLSNHMLLHSGIKPFQCNICNKAFSFRSNLRIHKKKHGVTTA